MGKRDRPARRRAAIRSGAVRHPLGAAGSMAPHARVRAGPRTEMPQAANVVAPIVIFSLALFVVYQVNHHTQLEGMIIQHELQHKEHHFATGGRKAQEGRAQSSITLATQEATVGSNTSTGAAGNSTQHSSGGGVEACHMEDNNEYHGDVVQWGDKHIVASAAECCAACQRRASDGCNVWVYCGAESCGPSGSARSRGECWLKKADVDEVLTHHRGKGHPGIAWTAGILYSDAQYSAWHKRATEKEKTEQDRLAKLRARDDLPLVWLDVSIKGKPVGRMEFVLFSDTSPLAAENMRRMCTGEVSPKHTLKGINFYRIIDQFIDQTGVDVQPCALGGTFKDDPEGLKLKHDRKGLLSVANAGHNTNTGHFSILMGPAPHLNGGYVIFGEMVSGWEVAVAVNKLSQGRPNNELLQSKDAVITGVGQIRRGKPVLDKIIQDGLVNHNL